MYASALFFFNVQNMFGKMYLHYNICSVKLYPAQCNNSLSWPEIVQSKTPVDLFSQALMLRGTIRPVKQSNMGIFTSLSRRELSCIPLMITWSISVMRSTIVALNVFGTRTCLGLFTLLVEVFLSYFNCFSKRL